MRIVYFGHHNAGVKCLEYLISRKEDVAAVVVHPPDPGEHVWYGSVESNARASGLEVIVADDPKAPDFLKRLKEIKPDIIFLVSFRKMLPGGIIHLPPMGCINLHDSLLPKYRGFTPCTWVLINGEKETGVTMLYVDEGVDSGDIISQKKVRIADDDTGHTLNQKLADASRGLFEETFPKIKDGTAPRVPQVHAHATYGKRRRPEDGVIPWEQDSRRVCDWVRALTFPYPGAFTFHKGRKLFVWKVKVIPGNIAAGAPGQVREEDGGVTVGTKDGAVLLEEVQFEGETRKAGNEIRDLKLQGMLGQGG